MTDVVILTEEQIQEQLKDLPGWKYADNKISKEFEFDDFSSSLAFIKSLESFFNDHDHHPDTHIYYSKVVFELQRFDVGGKVTDLDFVTAHKIEDSYNAK